MEWTIHDLASNMQGEGQTDVLITDFENAFDKVGYRHLIHRQEFQKAQYWVLASSCCTYSPVHVKDLAESLSTKVDYLLMTLYYTWLFSLWTIMWAYRKIYDDFFFFLWKPFTTLTTWKNHLYTQCRWSQVMEEDEEEEEEEEIFPNFWSTIAGYDELWLWF